ncbi:ComF family protein [Mycobacterium sp. CVI_P3]|uniref:ComF family protein n=1 Tax=Mycobacterium pinniadriaticum TaxID=2994102 RepID=A0ABT3SMS5_9MYCO|nr:ComF family protein [Mycobacterium pinniadriaticum]MCX2934411.1 ComF family protein [Mycobacterium pinniadriaticum]MCX2940834.1 ComF family protein [Mycobacterium pinniadriaticum]
MLDLILPLECGGCGTPSTTWCDACAAILAVHADEPHLVTPRIDPGPPVFALGRYAGPRRQAIVAVKERGRRDLVAPLARALALGIHQLVSWGILDTPFTVVPAPTRAAAARRRGGDPITRIAARATRDHPEIDVTQALRTRAMVRDSVGLTGAARERNVTGRIKLRRPVSGEILLVDDIVTTGATAREAVRVLEKAGAKVTAVLTLAQA